MNIALINGSPKINASNTVKLANAFLEGLRHPEDQLTRIDIYKSRIEPCRGCYSCWTRSPGKCIIRDDMTESLLDTYFQADLTIWSMPLYAFGMPSQVKAFIDRTLPGALPGMETRADGKVRHPMRVDISGMRHVLISSCGFYAAQQNYEALLAHFDMMGKTPAAKILCPEGEVLSASEAAPLWQPYLKLVRQAGAEFRQDGRIAGQTQNALDRPLLPAEAFMAMANAHWNSAA